MIKKIAPLLFLLCVSCGGGGNTTTDPTSESEPFAAIVFFYIDIKNNSEHPVTLSYEWGSFDIDFSYLSASRTIPAHSTAKAAIPWHSGLRLPVNDNPPGPWSIFFKTQFFDTEDAVIAAPIIAGWPEGMSDDTNIIHYGFGWIVGTNLGMCVAQDGTTNEYPYSDIFAISEDAIEWPYPDNIFDENRLLHEPNFWGAYFLFCDMKITITDTNDITVRVLDVYNTPRSNG